MDDKERFLEITRNMLNTPNGQMFLKTLVQDYLHTSPYRSNMEETLKEIGKIELVQELLEISNISDEYLQEITFN